MNKQKRYWLRTGIGLFVIDVVASIIVYGLYNFIETLGSPNILNPLLPKIFLLNDIAKVLSIAFLSPSIILLFGAQSPILAYGINFLIYFTVGAFLGWIYGKIKNRNRVNY